jgi:hypothetical protein
MVDVGGYRLHLNCTGSGIPTVVIEAGWGIRLPRRKPQVTFIPLDAALAAQYTLIDK